MLNLLVPICESTSIDSNITSYGKGIYKNTLMMCALMTYIMHIICDWDQSCGIPSSIAYTYKMGHIPCLSIRHLFYSSAYLFLWVKTQMTIDKLFSKISAPFLENVVLLSLP